MSFSPDAISMLDKIVMTPEDDEAFRAGYGTMCNPASRLSFVGSPHLRIGFSACVSIHNVTEGSWLDGQHLTPKDGMLFVDNPAFLLGAGAAAAALVHDNKQFANDLSANT